MDMTQRVKKKKKIETIKKLWGEKTCVVQQVIAFLIPVVNVLHFDAVFVYEL